MGNRPVRYSTDAGVKAELLEDPTEVKIGSRRIDPTLGPEFLAAFHRERPHQFG